MVGIQRVRDVLDRGDRLHALQSCPAPGRGVDAAQVGPPWAAAPGAGFARIPGSDTAPPSSWKSSPTSPAGWRGSRSSPTTSGTAGTGRRATLFARLHPELWDAVGHNPKAFLKRIDEQRLVDAADDPVVPRAPSTACCRPTTPTTTSRCGATAPSGCAQTDLVAYFCAEFGFHESLPIYSGGLGILAGDHCKAASDMRLPFVGGRAALPPGLLLPDHRRRGQPARRVLRLRFRRPADRAGEPTSDGADLRVDGRAARAARSRSRCGRRASATSRSTCSTPTSTENAERDRDIAHRLYGGDRTTRIEQEIVLGVGGVRALARDRPEADGVAHQRGPRRVPDPGAHPRR